MSGFIELFLKSIPLGISNTLPGISGGTMALILKIFDRLVEGIKNINLKILIPVFLGAASGVLISSKFVTVFLELYPDIVLAFLFGLILASSKITAAEIDEIDIKKIILIFLGIFLAVIISTEVSFQSGNKINLYLFFIGGFLGSMAMILPGISGGTILVLMGIYRPVLDAINNINIMVLFVFGTGLILGLLTVSRLISFFLKNYRSLIMALLTGLILGSLYRVIPGVINIKIIVSFITGYLVIELMSRVNLSI
ncbi:MAG: DUF368 domain-containing protein [Halanaerobiaceae bacterium]